jgi:hypothetical protein
MTRFSLSAVPQLFALAVLVSLGCGGGLRSDTCTGGVNMTSPRLVAGLEPSAGGALARITWDPGTDAGAQLPSGYFAAVQLSPETPAEVQSLVSGVSQTGEREITVRFRNLGGYLSTHDTLDFILAFPDRRGFISCSHRGMDDEYLLKVHLKFNAQQQLQEAVLTEEVILGEI